MSLLTIVSLVPLSFVSAVDYDQEIQDKENEKTHKQQELDASKNRQYRYETEGLTLSQKLSALEDDLSDLASDISSEEQQLDTLESEVTSQQSDVDDARQRLGDVSRTLYISSRTSIVELMFSSQDLADLIRQIGFQRYGLGRLVREVKACNDELVLAAAQYNTLSDEISALKLDLSALKTEVTTLENQKRAYEQMAAAEAAKQSQLIGQIGNITAAQQQLIQEKMQATEESTTVGDREDVKINLPTPPFSPAYAVASIGYPHRIGLSQYGAYGRAKAGQTYDQILSAYFSATLTTGYSVPDQINVVDYCTKPKSDGTCAVPLTSGRMPFEDQYLKGIAEMPTSWGSDGGYEALKAQAVLARSYALSYTNGGASPICATEQCQVYYHPKVTAASAAKWHQAVADTRGQVLTYNGAPVKAFYASTAGGYTRLPKDFDVWGNNGSNLPYLKRVADIDANGKAYDGPAHGDSPWYYKVWYAASDKHPWLTQDEMTDLLNAALLPDMYNSNLSHQSVGGWSVQQVRAKLTELGIAPIDGMTGLSVVNSSQGYTMTLHVETSSGIREVDGKRFGNIFKLRSRGHLALWSSLYDVVER